MAEGNGEGAEVRSGPPSAVQFQWNSRRGGWVPQPREVRRRRTRWPATLRLAPHIWDNVSGDLVVRARFRHRLQPSSVPTQRKSYSSLPKPLCLNEQPLQSVASCTKPPSPVTSAAGLLSPLSLSLCAGLLLTLLPV